MKESVIYQSILKEGRQEGLQRGLQQGLQQGRQQGEINLILKQLHRRFGELEPRIEAQIRGLPMAKLEELGENLLDFRTKTDYLEWLKQES